MNWSGDGATVACFPRMMMKSEAIAVSAVLWTALNVCAVGCGGPSQSTDSSETREAIGGFHDYEPFPSHANIEQAIERYRADMTTARARDPMSLNEFFGRRVDGIGGREMRVELLKSNERGLDKPLAFIYAGYTMYEGPTERGFEKHYEFFNDRYKDVRLSHMITRLQSPAPPFPEAGAVVADHGHRAVLVRLWTDFHQLSEPSPPPGLHGDALLSEIARIGIWVFVTSNLDGLSTANAGFTRVRDASGREFWRGVIIDGGASLTVNAPTGDPWADQFLVRLKHKPWQVEFKETWQMHFMGTDGIQGKNIPLDVVNSVTQIAKASDAELTEWLLFDHSPHKNAPAIINQVRNNAREVVDHYRAHDPRWQ
ncbi:MAG: hypothetical protein NVSMB1_04850 [Polyangiales bacterium]